MEHSGISRRNSRAIAISQHSISFGTSGLRGHAEGFTKATVDAYVGAFLATSCAGAKERTVCIGADLRASSPEIARLVAGAVTASGWAAHYAGVAPTPALAAYALARSQPAIMVTGSHIPAEYNGLKFYRPDGELLKSDEAPIRAAATAAEPRAGSASALPPPDPAVIAAYKARYRNAFAANALASLRIGIFEHSAAGRDVLAETFEALGATCIRFGRSEDFVAIDTEAVAPEQLSQMRAMLARNGLDAIVSTDGDGDRPLLLDERGNQINGDVLGALTARALGAKIVVTPLTSSGALEMSGWFEIVLRTRIGSPYVVAAMAGAGERVVGFEANGGFLVETPVPLANGTLPPLPTRDALLPLIAVLAESVAGGKPLSALAAELPGRAMKADRLKDIAPARGMAFAAAMAADRGARAAIDPLLADPRAIDTMDGTRLTLGDGTTVHVRQSGNAPELRCYVETDDTESTTRLLDHLIGRLDLYFRQETE